MRVKCVRVGSTPRGRGAVVDGSAIEEDGTLYVWLQASTYTAAEVKALQGEFDQRPVRSAEEAAARLLERP